MLSQLDQTHGFLQAQPLDPLADFLFPDKGFGGFWSICCAGFIAAVVFSISGASISL